MADVEHEDIAAANMHPLVRWTWANEAARLAQAVTADDIHKLGYQQSDSTYWLLADVTPSVWVTASSSDATTLLGAPLDSSVGAASEGDFLVFDGTEWKASKFATQTNVDTGVVAGLVLQNTTPSTLLQGQASPALIFAGGWGSGANMLGALQMRPDGPVISGSSDPSRELQFIYTEDLIAINKLFGLATNGVTQRLTVYGATRGEVAFESGGTIIGTTSELELDSPTGGAIKLQADTGYELKVAGNDAWVFSDVFGFPGFIAFPEFGDGTAAAFIIGTSPPSGDRDGMAIWFYPGAGGTGDNDGGGFQVVCGNASGIGDGGGIVLQGGLGGPTSGAGGGIQLIGGTEDGGGNGGSITGVAGTSYGGTPGFIKFTGGEGAPGGDVTLLGGPSASGGAGKAYLLGGDGVHGGDANVTAGESTGSTPGNANVTGGSGPNGGDANITGGTPSGGRGGSINLTGTAGFGSDKDGGSILGLGGDSTGTGDPGSIAFVAGNATDNRDGGIAGFGAGNGFSFGAGGPVTVFAGDGGSDGGVGGDALVRGGDAGAAGVAGGEGRVRGGAGNNANSPGGPAILQGGPAGTTGAGGAASVLGGTPTDGDGGAVSVLAADGVSGGTNRNGGQADLRAGSAALAGIGGSAFVRGGGGGVTGTAGFAHLVGGAGPSTGPGAGGEAIVEGGTPINGDGGTVRITGADAVHVSGGGKLGGSVIVKPGALAGGGLDGSIQLKNAAGTKVFEIDSTGLGFFNHATGGKPTVTGSRGGNAALASLLTALSGLGLLTDSSS